MRVIVMTDLEGISGICVWNQTRNPDPTLREEARRLLMGDVNALVDGLLEGGATEVVVEDAHASGFNFIPEFLHPEATHIIGKSRPKVSQRGDLYEGFDAGILLGYHAMAGTQDGFLNHSQSSKACNQYWYNDIESGEITQWALIFGHFGTPVIMVTSDDAGCREARELLGENLTTVSVKKGLSVEYGVLLPPAKAHQLIREGAIEAMKKIDKCKPFTMDLPIKGRLRFNKGEKGKNFKPKRAERVGEVFEATFERALDVLEF